MGARERKIAKLLELINNAVKSRNKIDKYFIDNTKLIHSYLSTKANDLSSFLNEKLIKYRLSLHDESGNKPLRFNETEEVITTLFKADKETVHKSELSLYKLFADLSELYSKKDKKKLPKQKKSSPPVRIGALKRLTQDLLTNVVTTQLTQLRLSRLKTFLQLLIRHPAAKHFAITKGAVGIFLFIRKTTKDPATYETTQKLLSILGYADPPRSRGIRILSIDGGGMRGIAVIRMLQTIEELSGKRICDLFDFICGVSTGAIITSCLIPPNSMTLDSIYNLYKDLSAKVFNQSALWGTSKLLWSGAYYDTSLWEKLLRDYVGNVTLLDSTKYPIHPKVAIVSTIVNQSKVTPFIFRNYSEPRYRSSEYHGSYKHTLFEAVRASAAAPTIFEEFKIGGLLHQDGGLVVNNPTAIALHEAKRLWPNESVSCVVSIGTGRYEPVLDIEDVAEPSKSSSSWKQIFTKILESATDTEAVHRILNDLLPEDVYFRLNPYLSNVVTMDEVNELKISRLENDTKMYCRRNEEKFYELVEKLKLPRSPLKKSIDYIKLMLKLYGVTD